MTPTSTPLITDIAAVLQKDYSLGPDSAPSIVRKVLEMSAAHYAAIPAGWCHDEHCRLKTCAGNAVKTAQRVLKRLRKL